jgi:hypothetical protein
MWMKHIILKIPVGDGLEVTSGPGQPVGHDRRHQKDSLIQLRCVLLNARSADILIRLLRVSGTAR